MSRNAVRHRPPLRSVALGLALLVAGAAAAEPALVVEHPSGRVLHAREPDAPWFPASLAKLMTLYLVFEALEGGLLSPDAALPVSRAAAGQPATRLGLRAGTTIRAADAVAAVATVSANDAAVVLAEALAGSETEFAVRMTARARALGMRRTVFRNASGLPDEGQVTTAREMAMLARRLLADFPDRSAVFAERSFAHGGRTRGAHNRLLGAYPGADGLKTGFTCASGFNIVLTSERGGRRLLGVVLGGASRHARDARAKALLDAAFAGTAPDDAPLLDTAPAAAVAARAPVRLTGEACARFARRAPLRPGNLPGWGLLFGVFPDRDAGRAALRTARRTVRPVSGAGIPVLLERRLERGTSYKALLVGLDLDGAGRGCKALWAEGRTCVVQSPAAMNARGYEMR